MGAEDGRLKLKTPMCSLSLLYDVFLDRPSDLPFLWIHMMRDLTASKTLQSDVYGLMGSPTPRRGARHQPNPCLCLVPIGNHLILARRRTMQRHREIFSSFHKAKKCQCFCLAYFSQAGDQLRDPSNKAWCCRSCNKPYTTRTSQEGSGRRKPYLNWSCCTHSAEHKSRLSQMLMRWHRLWAGFVLFPSWIKQQHVKTRELKG